MPSNSVANPVPARRVAGNGRSYTRSELHEYFKDAAERHWANASEVRLANDGRLYTRSEFRDFYGDEEERHWTNAGWQLVDGDEEERYWANAGWQLVDAPQLAVTARLKPEHVIPIQQEEAARGPPRSLHKLARDALNKISARPARPAVNLDG